MSQKYESKRNKKRRQKNRWIAILLGLGGLALLVLAALSFRGGEPKAAIEVTGAPSIKVDKEQVDLGDVKLDLPVQVTFKVTNVGDQTLRFEEQPYIEVVEGC
jgi:hypothetical protein